MTGWRRLLALPLALLIRAWGMSLRFRPDPESEKIFRTLEGAMAFVLWHNRLFIVSEISRRYRPGRPVHGLVSASKDGAWLEAFFEMMGIKSVRGSSSRMGREAATALVDVLRLGHDIGITPDGPRGPCYDFKGGAVIVTRRAQAPIVLIGATYSSCFRLRSWDRFAVPFPFAKVTLRAVFVPVSEVVGDRDELTARLASRLREINPD